MRGVVFNNRSTSVSGSMMQKCRKGLTRATHIAYNIIKVSSSSCVLSFKRPSTSGILETVRVLKEITNLLPIVISAFNKYRPRYIVNLCLCLCGTKTFSLNEFFLNWHCLRSHTLLPLILLHVSLTCFLLMRTPNNYQTQHGFRSHFLLRTTQSSGRLLPTDGSSTQHVQT